MLSGPFPQSFPRRTAISGVTDALPTITSFRDPRLLEQRSHAQQRRDLSNRVILLEIDSTSVRRGLRPDGLAASSQPSYDPTPRPYIAAKASRPRRVTSTSLANLTAAQLAPTCSSAAFGRDIVTAASAHAVDASSMSARSAFDHFGDAVQQCPDFRGQRLLGQERHRPGHLARKESAIQPHSPIPPSATSERQREEAQVGKAARPQTQPC
jgi:hypothetical protein